MAAEKRGFTGKLDYDFPTHGVCEVQLSNDEWYRVTERDFRSFDGPRRYTIPDYTLHKAMDVPMTTTKYIGPVYLWGTNTYVPYKGTTSKVLNEIMSNVRSGMSYSGANTLKELIDNAVFRRQTTSSHVEGNPHIFNRNK